MIWRLVVRGPLYLLLSLLCIACTSSRSQGPRPIEFVVNSTVETLDPRHLIDATSLRATRLIHAGLARLDPVTMRPIPCLAESWDWRTNTELHVVLRSGVRFHSGKVATADDVAATLRAFASSAVSPRLSRVYKHIDRIDVESPTDLTIHLSHPHATLLTDLEVPILRADEAASPPRPDGTLDGLGPFVVESFAASEVRLRPASFGVDRPPLHAVTIRTIRDETARALRLQSGRTDIAVNAVSPTLLPAIKAPLDVASRGAVNLTYIALRVDSGVFANAEARRALSLAINRQLLADTLFAHFAQPADTLLSPLHWAHRTNAPQLYLPQEAKRIFATLPVRHAELLVSPDRFRSTLARVMSQELADCGFDLQIVPLEFGAMMARMQRGDFDAVMLQIPEIAEPNVLRVFLHSQSIPPHGANRGRINNHRIDELLEQGEQTIGEEERAAIYTQLEQIVRDEMVWVPLWHENHVVVRSERARWFLPSADGRWQGLAKAE